MSQITVSRLCPICQTEAHFQVQRFQWQAYEQGYETAQQAFANLQDDEFTQLIAGVHGQCFTAVTGKKPININIKEKTENG